MDYSQLFSLDLETEPTNPNDTRPVALEPYRQYSGEARISSMSVAGPDGYVAQASLLNNDIGRITDLLHMLKGKQVICHNTVFDTAWLIGSDGIDILRPIKWRDTFILAKWLLNGQPLERGKSEHHNSDGKFSLSLANLVKTFLKGHPLYEEFLDVKNQNVTPGQDPNYWLRRGRMDAILTRDLYIKLIEKLPQAQRRGYIIECNAILPTANSWMNGIVLNKNGAKELKPKIQRAKAGLAGKLGKPEGMFTSPKQLSHYLFNELGLKPISYTPTGSPSTGADDLKRMAYDMAGTKAGDIIKTILEFKQVKTLESKYIDGILKVCNYNGSNINHSAPRMFGTYTGRFTYSSKTLNKEVFRPGIATHQLPRKGPTRGLLTAPEGYMVGELDAAAQEMRGMAIESRDAHMLDGFNRGINLHSSMGAYINGIQYEEFERRRKAEDKDTINYRYAGKLLNLSCQYRIGKNAIASKFFTTYGIVISQAMGASYLRMYKERYPGVPLYWDKAIQKAKQNGYAETIAGRRYQLTDWNSKAWATESSAINFPIQGFGADHKDVAISSIFKQFPEVIFVLDLHDGLWYYIPDDRPKELLLEMRDYLNTKVDYNQLWDADIPIPLLFDAQLGPNFKNVHEL